MKKVLKELFENEIIRYIFIGGCTTLVNFAAFWVLYDLFQIDTTLSNVLSITISIVFAYITNRVIVFQSKVGGAVLVLKELAKFFSSRIFTMFLEIASVWVIANVFKKRSNVG